MHKRISARASLAISCDGNGALLSIYPFRDLIRFVKVSIDLTSRNHLPVTGKVARYLPPSLPLPYTVEEAAASIS